MSLVCICLPLSFWFPTLLLNCTQPWSTLILVCGKWEKKKGFLATGHRIEASGLFRLDNVFWPLCLLAGPQGIPGKARLLETQLSYWRPHIWFSDWHLHVVGTSPSSASCFHHHRSREALSEQVSISTARLILGQLMVWVMAQEKSCRVDILCGIWVMDRPHVQNGGMHTGSACSHSNESWHEMDKTARVQKPNVWKKEEQIGLQMTRQLTHEPSKNEGKASPRWIGIQMWCARHQQRQNFGTYFCAVASLSPSSKFTTTEFPSFYSQAVSQEHGTQCPHE